MYVFMNILVSFRDLAPKWKPSSPADEEQVLSQFLGTFGGRGLTGCSYLAFEHIKISLVASRKFSG
jgi:hypothetical protein